MMSWSYRGETLPRPEPRRGIVIIDAGENIALRSGPLGHDWTKKCFVPLHFFIKSSIDV